MEKRFTFDEEDDSDDYNIGSNITGSSSLFSNDYQYLQSPRLIPIQSQTPSPYFLLGKHSDELFLLTPRHFSLVSSQSENHSCNNSDDESKGKFNSNSLFKARAKLIKFCSKYSKENKQSADYESIYAEKFRICELLNQCDEKQNQKKGFKKLREAIKKKQAIIDNQEKRNYFRLSSQGNSLPYILSILEMNYKDTSKKKSLPIRKSSKL